MDVDTNDDRDSLYTLDSRNTLTRESSKRLARHLSNIPFNFDQAIHIESPICPSAAVRSPSPVTRTKYPHTFAPFPTISPVTVRLEAPVSIWKQRYVNHDPKSKHPDTLATTLWNEPFLIYTITAMQISVYILSMAKYNNQAFSRSQLIELGSLNAVSFANQPWTFFTSILLNANIADIVYTVVAQVVVSRQLHRVFWKSHHIIAIIFALSSWTAIFISAYADRSPGLGFGFGTNGGIMGLFGAVYADCLKNWPSIYRFKHQFFLYQIPFGVCFALCSTVPYSNVGALAGAVGAGFLLGLLLIPFFRREPSAYPFGFMSGLLPFVRKDPSPAPCLKNVLVWKTTTTKI
ncbi:hypothetical protein SeMB42_g03013 [Synchytrium endobioticum]|uniref:Rhomboid-type serine protease n=1 Tax=Synchytrium endobioticum TaxID=286115 RepID=A0A507D6C5_9FUNG|nr:hypothetical protein SeLEV6574_g02898 [Synchytrium endobioticum]TPX48419.1 hypothetical protein SeMB42_g03013 [Synchytrium endobioticum]